MPTDDEIVVIENESLDILDPVEGLARDGSDAVVGEVDDAEVPVFVPHTEDVPVQHWDVVAVEDEDLGLGREGLKHVHV